MHREPEKLGELDRGLQATFFVNPMSDLRWLPYPDPHAPALGSATAYIALHAPLRTGFARLILVAATLIATSAVCLKR